MTVTSDFWRGVDVCSICIDLDERILTGEEKRRSKGLYCIWESGYIFRFFCFLIWVVFLCTWRTLWTKR